MSDPSTSSPSGGVSRFVGVGLSLVTGFVVFTVGVSLFPVEPPHPAEVPQRPPIASLGTAGAPAEATPSPAGAGGAPAATGPSAGGDAAAPAAPIPDGGAEHLPEIAKPPANKAERTAMKPSATAARALGLDEVRAVLDGTTDEATACRRLVERTRQYARRQEIWMRRIPGIELLDPAAAARAPGPG